MIDDILKQRKYVIEYDKKADIPRSLIDSLLYRTWQVTPSKNNFMPYTVHVIGPDYQAYKDLIFKNCASSEGLADGIENPLETRYSRNPPAYANILTCSYLFVFTIRLEDKPNPFQRMLIRKGHRYEAVDESRLGNLYSTASLEVGLFCDCLSALLLEHDIDVSFTGCFHRDVQKWEDVPFVKREPLMIMTAGKGKVYRQDVIQNHLAAKDLRPDYKRIINFV